MSRVIVVGAGVVGLTCAVRLLEAGHRVDVLARDLPLETTSAVAAAFWYPYRALPQDKVTSWSGTSYAVFDALADTDPESGVRVVEGTEVFTSPEPDPWWRTAVPSLDRQTSLPHGYVDGWTFASPIIEMPVYLPWLVERLEALGGTLTRMNLKQLPAGDGLVVNCTGLGARLLASDKSVVPVRGQVVCLEQTGVDTWWVDPEANTYIFPRSNDVVVGGTDDEGEWSRTPSMETADAILRRAEILEPRIRGARVIRHKVGLRPVRPAVRLERVGDVVHCYGHGGAGVTLSWGVADEVVSLA